MPIWKDSVPRKSKAIITGVAGFAGSYLAEKLLSEGLEIYGLLAPPEKTDNIAQISRQIHLDRFDLTNRAKMAAYVKKIKPDYIFHLAAMASVGQSLRFERLTYEVNIFGTLNLLEAAMPARNLRKFLLVGSADSYGIIKPKGKIIKETDPFQPVSPYGISKAAAEYLAGYYLHQYHIPVVIARSFNHTGPRQSDNFAIPSFCRQIAEIEHGLRKPQMAVGDLSARRDLSDVRDIVEGYFLLVQKGKPGEVYHLCSGRTVSIKSVLEKLLRMSKIKIRKVIDENRLRKSDIPVLKGDNRKAVRELDWKPLYSLEKTLKDTLDYWREKVTE